MPYNSDALLRGIEQSKANIKTFEQAIDKERQQIKEYYRMIEKNDEQERLNKLKKGSIEIEREDG